jgi:7-cyano-7-deazaguanine reductase
MPSQPSRNLETFPNPHPGRDYIIEIETPEFTCLCPKTGQPDFATLRLEYVPEKLCVELKSLKLYIWSYRDEGHFHEDVTNRILGDLVALLQPRYLRLTMVFNVRGGVYTTVNVEHRQPGWQPPPPPPGWLPREKVAEPADPDRATISTAPSPPATRTATAKIAAPAEAASGSRFRMLRRSKRNSDQPENEAPVPEAAPPPPPPPPAVPARPDAVYLGVDLGTSGCRIVAIDAAGEILAQGEAPIPVALRKDNQITQDPTRWWKAVSDSLHSVLQQVNPLAVRAIAVDGTSGTLLLADAHGVPVTPAILYNDQRAIEQAALIASVASPQAGCQGASSSLAKLLWLRDKGLTAKATYALHQADWIAGRLSGIYGRSDYNNTLKMGFDPVANEWPAWLGELGVEPGWLPAVHVPGDAIGNVSAEMVRQFGFHPDTQVMAGTTDGVAAFIAAGADQPGHGVTSLGTTLVLKLLSTTPVFSPAHGIYSHRLGKFWLAGGASNSGGVVLQQYFKIEQMREMTPLLDPETFTGLEYYPLPEIGERFPINDPEMSPRLEPLPGDSVTFFQGMLEGIARIEALGYQLLNELGAPKVGEVRTTGGGSKNPAWTRIRERTLKVPVKPARSSIAAHGAALLASGAAVKTFR